MTRRDASVQVPDLSEFRAFGTLARSSTTLEVRWIDLGSVPEAMVAWLGPFDDWIERREDRYLVDPSVSDLGIKIKDAVQFDLKAFRGSLGRLEVPGAGRGHLELWEKWSFPLHASALPPADAAGWLALEKTRRRRSFEVGEDEAMERPMTRAEQPGCSVELTEVAVGGERWWTLGIEATGGRETLERNLRATAKRVFRGPSPVPALLDLGSSMSYPQWLYSHGYLRRHLARPVRDEVRMEDLG
jgi:hypothetical protein